MFSLKNIYKKLIYIIFVKHLEKSAKMTSEQKKALLLLKSVIFHYHGLDEDEKSMLEQTAKELDAYEELEWANNFVSEDYYTAFERSRAYLNEVVSPLDNETKLSYLKTVWNANMAKGYISEIEATALLKLAKDWHIQKELIQFVRNRD